MTISLPETNEKEVPCGFCGKPTYPALCWPSLDDPKLYVWCCEQCENELEDEDDRIVTVTVNVEVGDARP